jgi:hypothetical protein
LIQIVQLIISLYRIEILLFINHIHINKMNLQKSNSLELMSKINRRNSNILYILFFVVVGGLLSILGNNDDDYIL